MSNHLRVLLAEGETDIRTVAADALADAGFDVIEAPSGDVALHILAAEGDMVDAVVTNANMPGPVSAHELVRKVRETWPWISLIMAAGDRNRSGGSLPDGTRIVAQPLSISLVPREVRSAVWHAA